MTQGFENKHLYIATVACLLSAHLVCGDGGWSECSRSCGGGVTHQLRSCKPGQPCADASTFYKTCNVQDCPSARDNFRAEQCASHNPTPYKGKLYKWQAVYSNRNPCKLLCTPDDHSFIAELSPKVVDGTRCRPRSRNVCVDGECVVVGCDYELDSGMEEDACGVCGGDGTSCLGESASNTPGDKPAQQGYRWEHILKGPCSVSCGVGSRDVQYKCVDSGTDKPTDDEKCEKLKEKPEEKERCKLADCAIPAWISGHWQPCSSTCGGGMRTRYVYCMERLSNGSFVKLEDERCTDRQLISEKPCNLHPCPSWHAGQWSPCSVTCGVGSQKREVICRSTEHYECSKSDKPATRRRCRTNTPCNSDKALSTSQELKSNRKEVELYGGGRVSEGNADVMELGHNKVQSVEIPGNNQNKAPGNSITMATTTITLPEDGGRSITSGSGEESDVFHFGDERLVTRKPIIIQQQRISSQPHFDTSAWSSCSTSCGSGTKNRVVQCQAFDPSTNLVQYLPDTECRENKPEEAASCYQPDCPEETDELHINTHRVITAHPESHDIVNNYEWHFTSYGQCNAPCLGGVKNAEFECVRIIDKFLVKDAYCASIPKPQLKPKPCNKHACSPRWRLEGFGPCSAMCGGGHQARTVECVQDVSRSPPLTRPVADELCPQPVPPRLLRCNRKDCLASWEASPWSKCSSPCGKGVETRSVYCQQVVYPGKAKNVTEESLCLAAKPPSIRPCARDPCPTQPPATHNIQTDTSNYVQLKRKRKISVTVGGTATVIAGTSLVVQCPVSRDDKNHIHWMRKENEITKKGRIKMTKQGNLQIRRSKLRDSDTYECMIVMDDNHVMDKANISIKFHSDLEGEKQLEWRKKYMMEMHKTGAHKKMQKPAPNAANTILKMPNGDRLLMDSLMGEEMNYSIPYMYISSEWNPCSETCGGAGYQKRSISCELITENYYRAVNESLCKELGQEKPIETRDCGFGRCPRWMIGEWSQCSGDSCFAAGVGSMVRPTYCIFPNRTQAPHQACDTRRAPTRHHPCQHGDCTAGWTVTEWSACSKTCGGEGTRSRILKCLWKSNNLPAGRRCNGQPRPDTFKPCQAPPCHKMRCMDKSKYCNLVPMLKLCKYKAYKHECCYSCNKYQHKLYRKG